MKTPNGTTNNVHPLHGATPTANQNLPGHIPARDLFTLHDERAVANDRIGYRLHYPVPRSDLEPPYQAFDSTVRGFLQAIDPDPMV
jgi:hypothetical protein